MPESLQFKASNNMDSLDSWKQKQPDVKVRQFMNILEQLPRLCSPTICGTLSQPTTKTERASRGAELFEWSLEQKAILSPANITTDLENTDQWHHNAAEINSAVRKQESERFFSQRTIAPSPLITGTPSNPRQFRRPLAATFDDICDEEDEDEDIRDRSRYEDDEIEHDEMDNNNLLFSPQPLRSSQTQQSMDLFSPGTFVRALEDDTTLQSTPKTIASSVQGTRSISRRSGVLD